MGSPCNPIRTWTWAVGCMIQAMHNPQTVATHYIISRDRCVLNDFFSSSALVSGLSYKLVAIIWYHADAGADITPMPMPMPVSMPMPVPDWVINLLQFYDIMPMPVPISCRCRCRYHADAGADIMPMPVPVSMPISWMTKITFSAVFARLLDIKKMSIHLKIIYFFNRYVRWSTFR